ncbi:glutaminyl-tRNA synthetase [Aulographum hederae CBS 113979]|uniref:glutamine--tRNA ligase n=1 Tax=Aulographum hederae CBS 113979 TaxID=1176131 RepID=A0A6G1HGL2_9PEZI|nr:glutaminyl-tRNA synthetase [Aulographum hederae CBS 113979]
MPEPTPPEDSKGPSKRALEKERKKAEAKAKKAEMALRSKPVPSKSSEPSSVFAEGWLKRVYEEKPVSVRTRFPPEPNGFLHIGHAKAIAVNFGFAKHYNGVCFLRFDDTNPDAEKEIYFTAIKEMVHWLGFEPYKITHSSDHFDRLYNLAEDMIKKDKAYVCHCTKDEVNLQRGGRDNRGRRFACSHRERPIEESLTEFQAMRDGKYKAGEAHLRLKQSLTDPNEGNPQMWDLAAYRVIEKNHHHRTGDKWRIYPTYDFTHCLCDAFEEISHSLCTTEFYLSRTSYDWELEILDLKKPKSEEKGPMQREYGRLNVTGSILSKRRIAMLVKGATVEATGADGTITTKTIPPAVRGWDDPRLYTLVGIRRRGVPAEALLQFVSELGVTDALTTIQAARFEATIRRYLERNVPRLMLVLDPIKVIIEDLPPDHREDLNVPFDPKKPDGESRKVPLTQTLYIDRSDFREIDDPDFFRLTPGKIVGLLNVPFAIKATSFSKDSAGRVSEIKASKIEAEKPKAYIHWVSATSSKPVTARQYNTLFKCEEPNGLDWKTGGYTDDLNPESEIICKDAVIEEGLEQVMKGKEKVEGGSDELVRFQAVRTGYFAIDPEREGERVVLNQIVSLKEDAGKK